VIKLIAEDEDEVTTFFHDKLALYVRRLVFAAPCLRHLSEQYFTLSQSFSHTLRQAIGLPHATQGFVGR
jgi:hypothetical protein